MIGLMLIVGGAALGWAGAKTNRGVEDAFGPTDWRETFPGDAMQVVGTLAMLLGAGLQIGGF